MKPVNQMLEQATAATNEAALFVSLATANDARIADVFRDRQNHFAEPDPAFWYRRAISVLPWHENTMQELAATLSDRETALARVQQQLDGYRAQPAPLMGSREAAEFTQRVAFAERQLTDLRGECAQLRAASRQGVDLDAVRRGIAQVARCALHRLAFYIADQAAGLHRDTHGRLMTIARMVTDYEQSVARAEAVAGPLNAPAVTMPTTVRELIETGKAVSVVLPQQAKAA